MGWQEEIQNTGKIHILVSTTRSVEITIDLAIDGSLIEGARTPGGKKTVVTEALREYIQKRRQLQLTKFFGQIDYFVGCGYEVQRKRRGRDAGPRMQAKD